MTLRRREIAEKQLGPLFDDFRDSITAGTRRFWTRYEDDAHLFTTICRATMLRCFIAEELKMRLDGRPGIKIIEANQTTVICIGHSWLLKVHKFDEECHKAMNETQMCLGLSENDLHALPLPGLPESATVVFLGYIEILGERLRPEMRLSCPDGAKPAWVINLDGPPASSASEITSGGGGDDMDGGTKVVLKPQKGRKFIR
jgi:hypothetical protein